MGGLSVACLQAHGLPIALRCHSVLGRPWKRGAGLLALLSLARLERGGEPLRGSPFGIGLPSPKRPNGRGPGGPAHAAAR